MDEKALKTSVGQRIAMIVVAVLLVGATFLTYLFVVMNNGDSASKNSDRNDALVTQLAEEYDSKSQELAGLMKPVSEKYFSGFKSYLSEVKAYNSASANSDGLKTKDLKVGTGKTLTDGDTDYGAFYIGWCSDGTIFSSSFDDTEDPTELTSLLDPSVGLIEGWSEGVIGMKLGGVRQLSIPGELAYGDTEDTLCDGANTPLRFIIMAIEADKDMFALQSEMNNLQLQLYYAYYGSMY